MHRSVDTSRITAHYRDGVLEIRVPKREESRPRQIKIGGDGESQKVSAA